MPRFFLAFVFAFTTFSAQAQTWYKVATEASTTVVVLPAGTVYRFGSGSSWSPNVAVTVATTINPLFYPAGVFTFPDPLVGATKELDILQTANPQTVQMSTNNAAKPIVYTPVVVPAITILGTYTCTGVIIYSNLTMMVPSANCVVSQ